jgi:hypothetical protein
MTTETLAKSHLDNWIGATPVYSGDEMNSPEIYERYGSEWVLVPTVTSDIYGALAIYSAQRWERRTQSDLPDLFPSAFVVVTTGWGAPLGADGKVQGAPSEHPDRRRLRVVCCYAEDGTRVSRLDFGDNGETTETDDGAGQLAEALDSVGWALWGEGYGSALMELITQATGNPDRADVMKGLVGRLVTVLHASTQVNDDDDDESEGE